MASRYKVVTPERWQMLRAAAEPHKPIARARGELEYALGGYPDFLRDTAKLTRGRDTWQQVNELSSKLHAILTEEWQQGRVHYVPMIDDVFKRYLLRHSRPLSREVALRVSARKGQRDPDREWLYLQLLDIWINSFNGRLAASRTSTGGPCVRFIRTAIGFVLPADDVPKVRTVREIVQQLGRGEPLGNYYFDRVPGAQKPWR